MNGKLIPVFVLAALMSCSQPPVKEQGPRPVKLAEVTSLNLVEKSFSGVVSPDQFSDLAFKMSGPLISLKVDEGQKVRTGQVVADIDPQDFKCEYEAKKGQKLTMTFWIGLRTAKHGFIRCSVRKRISVCVYMAMWCVLKSHRSVWGKCLRREKK